MSFSRDYEEARAAFLNEARIHNALIHSYTVCEDDQIGALTMDVAVFAPSAENTLLVSSGVHGVEGFAGSAIQTHLIRRGLPSGIRVVMVHAVNPFGMTYLRRTNENNVDLNRNCLPADMHYSGCHDMYRVLDPLLNPRSAYRYPDFFVFKAALQIAKHGMPKLRQAVAGGQYAYPKGLFWGGSKLERSVAILKNELGIWTAASHNLLHLDLHTGLGRRKTYAIFVAKDGPDLTELRHVFGPRVQSLHADASFAYSVSGGVGELIEASFPGQVESLALELGTASPVRVLQALRAENQAFFWGGDLKHAKAGLLEAFCPASKSWREAALQTGAEVFDKAVGRLM